MSGFGGKAESIRRTNCNFIPWCNIFDDVNARYDSCASLSIAEETRVPHTPVIAIVDDDESFRHATLSFIRSLNYSAAAFPSADAFLDSNAVENTDCLITDVQMPGMSGMSCKVISSPKGIAFPLSLSLPSRKRRREATRSALER